MPQLFNNSIIFTFQEFGHTQILRWTVAGGGEGGGGRMKGKEGGSGEEKQERQFFGSCIWPGLLVTMYWSIVDGETTSHQLEHIIKTQGGYKRGFQHF